MKPHNSTRLKRKERRHSRIMIHIFDRKRRRKTASPVYFMSSLTILWMLAFQVKGAIKLTENGPGKNLLTYNQIKELQKTTFKFLRDATGKFNISIKSNSTTIKKTLKVHLFYKSKFRSLETPMKCDEVLKYAYATLKGRGDEKKLHERSKESLEDSSASVKILLEDNEGYYHLDNLIDNSASDFLFVLSDCQNKLNYQNTKKTRFKFEAYFEIKKRPTPPILTYLAYIFSTVILLFSLVPQLKEILGEMEQPKHIKKNIPYIIVGWCLISKLVSLLLSLVVMGTCYKHCSDNQALNFMAFLGYILDHYSTFFFSVLVVLIGHGYTLFFADLDHFNETGTNFDLFFPLCLIVSIIKLVVIGCTTPWDSVAGGDGNYQGLIGMVTIATNMVLTIFFIVGIYENRSRAVTKEKDPSLTKFISWFGGVGLIFLMFLPLTILLFSQFEAAKVLFEAFFMAWILGLLKGNSRAPHSNKRTGFIGLIGRGNLYQDVSTIFGGRGLWQMDALSSGSSGRR